jgi:ABC-type transport system substrate-binding protein
VVRRGEFLAGVASAAACAPLSTSERLRIDVLPLGHDIDPYRDAEIGVDELAWLYADGLVGWEDGTVPLLAHLPERDEHGLRYHYRLRRAFWHDGRRVVAHDVADALEAVRAMPFGTREPYRAVDRIVIHDDDRFDVVLRFARPETTRSFFGAYGVPALPLVRRDTAGLPIGTGPFAVRSRPEPGRWILERFDESLRGRAAVAALDVRLLTSDATAAVQMLSSEADIALPLPPMPRDSPGRDRFRTLERTTSTAVLLFNAEGPFGDESLRRAFGRAIDVAALQRRYDPRRTTLFASLLLSGGNDPALERALTHDPRAQQSLGEGLRGHEVAIAYVGESSSHMRTTGLLQQLLQEAGVAADLRPARGIGYQGPSGPLHTGRFDIAIAGLVYGLDADFAADWSCAAKPPNGGNFARWCDRPFDAAAARFDSAAMLRRLYDTIACIPLSRAYELLAVGRRVGGFRPPSPLTPATYGCTRWSLASGSSTSARIAADGGSSPSRRFVKE